MIGWIFVYVCMALGLIVFDFYDAVMSLLELKNPLWKLAMCVAWPVTFVIAIFEALCLLLRDYVTEIENYYNEGRDQEESEG